jgi:hypothetical protein
LKKCRDVLAAGPQEEHGFAASVLLSELGWGSLTDQELKRLFLSKSPSVWRWTGLTLVKRDRRETLIEWSAERPESEQLDVIYMLAQRLPEEMSPSEHAFWLACVRRTPASIAYTWGILGRGAEMPREFRPPIREFLTREIADPKVKQNSQAEYDLVAALRAVHAWGDAADTPLLMSYLKHPCESQSYRSSGDKYDRYATYTVRQRVKPLLEERGAKIPADVIYERYIGPANDP